MTIFDPGGMTSAKPVSSPPPYSSHKQSVPVLSAPPTEEGRDTHAYILILQLPPDPGCCSRQISWPWQTANYLGRFYRPSCEAYATEIFKKETPQRFGYHMPRPGSRLGGNRLNGARSKGDPVRLGGINHPGPIKSGSFDGGFKRRSASMNPHKSVSWLTAPTLVTTGGIIAAVVV